VISQDKVIAPSLSEVKAQQDHPGPAGKSALINKTIAHYHITEILGEGGMGVVYKARDTKLDRTVALKFLPSHLVTGGRDFKKRFYREAKAAAALNHPNVCTIHSIEEFEGVPFLSMEWVDGLTLRRNLKNDAISLEQAIEYAILIADGLSEAHQAGIIHRDIKPENIMVDTKGRIKVMDFGIAKLKSSGQITKTDRTIGTMAYMSPEQIRGELADHRSDIWALGVVLYEMLAGEHPFAGKKNAVVLHSILNKEPRPVCELLPDCPRGVQEIVLKLLRKDPSKRYQHTEEIINNLQMQMHVKSTKYIGNSIAVLPLENLSPDPEDAFFAGGVHEEIISSLSGIRALRVIARSSVQDYSPKERNLGQIGLELGVSHLMEGTVRRAGKRIRVSMNLIDAEDNSMIWNETYEDQIEDVFGLQSRIAREVAGALQATLTASEQQRLQEQPTDNPQAYLFYMQGRDYLGRSRLLEENPLAAERLFRRALHEDPWFAYAYALLAVAYSDLYWVHGQSPERLDKMREAAERAELLAPNLAETQLAIGLYRYWSDPDHKQTLSHFQSALQEFPNHPVLHHFAALTHRRLGNWNHVERHFKKAIELDPRNPNHYDELAWLYFLIREFDKSISVADRLIELVPDSPGFLRYVKAWAILGRDGTLEGFESWRDEIYPVDPAKTDPFWWGYHYYYMKRDWDAALQDVNYITSDIAAQFEISFTLRDYLKAVIYDQKGDEAAAQNYFETSRAILESLLEEYPDYPRYRIEVGKVYARMGLPERAIKEGIMAAQLRPLSEFAYEGAWSRMELAYIYSWSGQYEEAIDILEHLLSVPSPVYRNLLRISPDWDPLRGHPRFQELIAERNDSN